MKGKKSRQPKPNPSPGEVLDEGLVLGSYRMMKFLDRIFDFLAVVISLILVFMTLSIGYSIFARAVNLPGPVWIVQFNEYAMLFATFLGAAWLLSKGKHVSIELVVSHFSRRTQKVFEIIHSVLGMGLCAILCWYGTLTTMENLRRKVIHVQAVDVPMADVLFVIPLGFFLLFLQFLRNFAAGLRDIKTLEGADHLSPRSGEKEAEGGGH